MSPQIDANTLARGLGGAANIRTLEPCITRLRVEVREPAKVDETALRTSGAFGVLVQNSVVQIVVGPVADTLSQELQSLRA